MYFVQAQQRSKNASRNVFFGLIQKVQQTLWPFIVRTVMIYLLGMEYVGLNGLFASILQVLNITELGVGTALTYSMYEPIVKKDMQKICQLMQLYKSYYRIIGGVILVVGVAITPLLPKIITNISEIPLNVYWLYWLTLINTVLSYWLFAYKNSILIAHQRTDVGSKISMLSNTIMYLSQIILLYVTKNYYLFLMLQIAGQILYNLMISKVSHRMYPTYKAQGQLDEHTISEINKSVGALFTAKLGGVIQTSVDSIVISAYLGLTLLAQYNNYYFILSAVFGFISILFTSSVAGVGNSIVTESDEKNYQDLNKMTFLTQWIVGICVCCLLCLYQPFILMWVGNKNVLPIGIVICLCVYLMIITFNQMLCVYKDASGIWQQDKWRPLITATINLCLNLILVRSIGLYGVVLSTVASMMLVGTPWLIHNIFKTIFNRSKTEYYSVIFRYVIVIALACLLTWFICALIEDRGILSFLLKSIICVIVPNLLFFVLYQETKVFREVIQMIDHLSNKRLRKIRLFHKYLL